MHSLDFKINNIPPPAFWAGEIIVDKHGSMYIVMNIADAKVRIPVESHTLNALVAMSEQARNYANGAPHPWEMGEIVEYEARGRMTEVRCGSWSTLVT